MGQINMQKCQLAPLLPHKTAPNNQGRISQIGLHGGYMENKREKYQFENQANSLNILVGREGFEPSTYGLRVRGAHYTQYANQMVGICTDRINSPFCTNFGKKVPTCHNQAGPSSTKAKRPILTYFPVSHFHTSPSSTNSVSHYFVLYDALQIPIQNLNSQPGCLTGSTLPKLTASGNVHLPPIFLSSNSQCSLQTIRPFVMHHDSGPSVGEPDPAILPLVHHELSPPIKASPGRLAGCGLKPDPNGWITTPCCARQGITQPGAD